jgi:hypothetical protein
VASGRTRRPPRGDVGVLVIGALAKTLLFIAVVGLVGYDSISVATTQINVHDQAQQAAQAGHEAYRAYGTTQAAYAAALQYAREHGDTLVVASFATGPNHSVTVELRREATTFFARWVPRVKNYAVADATATSSDAVN